MLHILDVNGAVLLLENFVSWNVSSRIQRQDSTRIRRFETSHPPHISAQLMRVSFDNHTKVAAVFATWQKRLICMKNRRRPGVPHIGEDKFLLPGLVLEDHRRHFCTSAHNDVVIHLRSLICYDKDFVDPVLSDAAHLPDGCTAADIVLKTSAYVFQPLLCTTLYSKGLTRVTKVNELIGSRKHVEEESRRVIPQAIFTDEQDNENREQIYLLELLAETERVEEPLKRNHVPSTVVHKAFTKSVKPITLRSAIRMHSARVGVTRYPAIGSILDTIYVARDAELGVGSLCSVLVHDFHQVRIGPKMTENEAHVHGLNCAILLCHRKTVGVATNFLFFFEKGKIVSFGLVQSPST
mmetsp:Transcript_340/g.646  ORF Transcript_340/g.646 Transcript_340/m.646 type:complete len:353 (-) Transcript_340:334-1392(-)